MGRYSHSLGALDKKKSYKRKGSHAKLKRKRTLDEWMDGNWAPLRVMPDDSDEPDDECAIAPGAASLRHHSSSASLTLASSSPSTLPSATTSPTAPPSANLQTGSNIAGATPEQPASLSVSSGSVHAMKTFPHTLYTTQEKVLEVKVRTPPSSSSSAHQSRI